MARDLCVLVAIAGYIDVNSFIRAMARGNGVTPHVGGDAVLAPSGLLWMSAIPTRVSTLEVSMSPISTTTTCGLMAAACVCFLVACNKGNNVGAGAAGGASATAIDTTRTVRSDTSAGGAAGGAVSPASYVSDMTDSNIVAGLDNLDKMEIAIAHFMQTKASNDSVRAFAKKLVEDHSKNEKTLLSLERQVHLAEVPAKADTTRENEMHTLQSLRSMHKGQSLDSAFVHAMVVGHEHAVASAKAMQNQAKNAELKEALGRGRPA